MGIKTKQTAFTLIELMVVVALVAIFALVGIPGYENMTTTNRMATEINGLMADIQFARSEAIKRGVNVSICTSNNKSTCNTPYNGWNAGWIVTTDGNSPVVLRVHSGITSSDNFSSTSTANNNLNTITFDRNGFSSNGGTVTISLNDQANTVSHRQCLMITMVGRISHDSGNNCQ